jgi:hypothetical protein
LDKLAFVGSKVRFLGNKPLRVAAGNNKLQKAHNKQGLVCSSYSQSLRQQWHQLQMEPNRHRDATHRHSRPSNHEHLQAKLQQAKWQRLHKKLKVFSWQSPHNFY